MSDQSGTCQSAECSRTGQELTECGCGDSQNHRTNDA